jgi:DNA-binding response OmpR family regulator
MARIKAILNRTSQNKKDIYTYESLEINTLSHTIKIDNKLLDVTPKEYDILNYLVQNKNIAISREQLLEKVWGYDFFGDDRTVDTHIKMLRNSLGKYRDHIKTVRSIGYKYVEDEE